ncbi:pyridoxamine 5'-phosphate oxidase [Leptospira sp. GIMC2001]|uniref:pyridoxamine 5'-phosphate oxidase n=1 Tax=Leptospira sp. GIMC2001 TaxID=1513297 RepID=UPI00234B78A6|nr:pyridoxamine 5'-phosphate oxidase [Leptospira sp. GIMC2001]WCL48384.1 pyridoxamine 5'-phosphate oxidase [Leptospira sp. GIMC2001]
MSEIDLASIRKNYSKERLDEEDVGDDPIQFFNLWMSEAVDAKIPEPTAMSVSTVSKSGRPSSRILLLKGVENGIFKFYSNYSSNKGQEIAQNPNVSLLFFWPELERQIRIDGLVEKLSREESTIYFHSRPRESQIGAHTSLQSSTLDSRESLEKKYEEFLQKFANINPIPIPENWGGYGLVSDRIEFWQGRPSRLHDRIVFKKENSTWQKIRLSP